MSEEDQAISYRVNADNRAVVDGPCQMRSVSSRSWRTC